MGQAKKQMMYQEEREAIGYDEPEYGVKFVCGDHFKNRYLREFIDQNSSIGTCSYCGDTKPVIDLAQLVEHIAGRLTDFLGRIDDQNLYLASSFIDREDEDDDIPGFKVVDNYIAPEGENVYDSYEDVAYDFDCLADLDEINTDIGNYFYVNRWIRKDPVSLPPNEAMKYSWSGYAQAVIETYRNLYKNTANAYDVDKLVNACPGKIDAYGLGNAIDIIDDCVSAAVLLKREYPVGTTFYRGRPDDNGVTYTEFKDLTSAPSRNSKANRLSQAGDSVFYGSFDEVTPVKEIQNYNTPPYPVISLGTFVSTKKLILIDFTNIPRPDFWMGYDKWQTYLFLSSFHEAITEPVSDNRSHVEYVPTQIFVHYLRQRYPRIDGIIYRSSLTGKPNVCLFYDNTSSETILSLTGTKII